MDDTVGLIWGTVLLVVIRVKGEMAQEPVTEPESRNHLAQAKEGIKKTRTQESTERKDRALLASP